MSYELHKSLSIVRLNLTKQSQHEASGDFQNAIGKKGKDGEQHQRKGLLHGVFGLHPHIFDLYASFVARKR